MDEAIWQFPMIAIILLSCSGKPQPVEEPESGVPNEQSNSDSPLTPQSDTVEEPAVNAESNTDNGVSKDTEPAEKEHKSGGGGGGGAGTGNVTLGNLGITAHGLHPSLHYCDMDHGCEEGDLCFNWHCHPVNGRNLGEGCSQPWHCAPGLECEDNHCARRYAIGSPCVDDNKDCGYDEYCNMGKCAAAPGQLGDPCITSTDCDRYGNEKLVCQAGTCRSSGDGTVGSPCGQNSECQKGLYCVDGSCAPSMGQEGETCQGGGECQPPLVCVLGQCCKELLEEGIPCESDEDCTSHNCLAKRCSTSWDLESGEECFANSDCDDLCVMGTCSEELLPKGSKCGSDLDCEMPLACIMGKCKGSQSKKGKACKVDLDCIWGLACKKSKCLKPKKQQVWPLES